MEFQALHFLHVFGAFLLVGYTFYAFAGPAQATRRKVLAITGLASLLILVSGVRMWQSIYGFAPLAWIIVKVCCWLGVSALAGIAYRRREKVGLFTMLALILVIVLLALPSANRFFRRAPRLTLRMASKYHDRPAPVAGTAPLTTEQKADLSVLIRQHQRGELTDDEFAAARRQLTGGA